MFKAHFCDERDVPKNFFFDVENIK